MLEEIAVVAGDPDHLTPGAEPETRDRLVHVPPRVFDPAVGVRCEVRVLGEQAGGALELLELDEKAPRADVDPQGVVGFHPAKLGDREIAVGER